MLTNFQSPGKKVQVKPHEDLGRENMLKSVPVRAPGSHQKGDESFIILKEDPSLKNTRKLLEDCSQLSSAYAVSSEWHQKQDHKLVGDRNRPSCLTVRLHLSAMARRVCKVFTELVLVFYKQRNVVSSFLCK